MGRQARVGSTAAALLPAALAAGVLVSAPFAGTTTAPLARGSAAATPTAPEGEIAGGPPAAGPAQVPSGGSGGAQSLAVLGAAELGFLALGAGVFVRARRRRAAG